METNTADKPRVSATGLDSVRAKAKKQNLVKLNRAADKDAASLQNIRLLKSKAWDGNDVELMPDPNVFSNAWDWFQRAIGNR